MIPKINNTLETFQLKSCIGNPLIIARGYNVSKQALRGLKQCVSLLCKIFKVIPISNHYHSNV